MYKATLKAYTCKRSKTNAVHAHATMQITNQYPSTFRSDTLSHPNPYCTCKQNRKKQRQIQSPHSGHPPRPIRTMHSLALTPGHTSWSVVQTQAAQSGTQLGPLRREKCIAGVPPVADIMDCVIRSRGGCRHGSFSVGIAIQWIRHIGFVVLQTAQAEAMVPVEPAIKSRKSRPILWFRSLHRKTRPSGG